jgi:hypothetical protein
VSVTSARVENGNRRRIRRRTWLRQQHDIPEFEIRHQWPVQASRDE